MVANDVEQNSSASNNLHFTKYTLYKYSRDIKLTYRLQLSNLTAGFLLPKNIKNITILNQQQTINKQV